MIDLKVILDGLMHWTADGNTHFQRTLHQQLAHTHQINDGIIFETVREREVNVPSFAAGVPEDWIQYLLITLVLWHKTRYFPWKLDMSIDGVTPNSQSAIIHDGIILERLSRIDSSMEDARQFFDALGSGGIFRCLGFNTTIGSTYNYMPPSRAHMVSQFQKPPKGTLERVAKHQSKHAKGPFTSSACRSMYIDKMPGYQWKGFEVNLPRRKHWQWSF